MTEQIESPLVSVIIPTKNRCGLLKETLASVQAQTYRNWEAVVVDDGSDDNTVGYVRSLAAGDPRIRLVKRQGERAGAQTARNQGMSASVGEYFLFLDSDDLLADNCLEGRIECFRANPQLDFCVFAREDFYLQQGDGPRREALLRSNCDLTAFFEDKNVPWQTMQPLWRKRFLLKNGIRWDESLMFGQDLVFHVAALACEPLYRKVENVDCYYRMPISKDNVSSKWYRPELVEHAVCLAASLDAALRKHSSSNRVVRKRLARFHLRFAVEYMRSHPSADRRLSDRIFGIWSLAFRNHLVGPILYEMGILLIRAQRVRYLGGALYALSLRFAEVAR